MLHRCSTPLLSLTVVAALFTACGGTEEDAGEATDTTASAVCSLSDDVVNVCGSCARSVPSVTGSGGVGPYVLSPGGSDVDVFRMAIPQGSWWVGFATGPAPNGDRVDTTCTLLDSSSRSCWPIAYDQNETAAGVATSSEVGCRIWTKVVSPVATTVQIAVTHGAATPLAMGQYKVFTNNHIAHGGSNTPPPWAPYPGYGEEVVELEGP